MKSVAEFVGIGVVFAVVVHVVGVLIANSRDAALERSHA